MAGRKRKYQTADELERAVDAYFAAISYYEPAIIRTPTGEVDDDGRLKWTTRMLREPTDEPGVSGPPVKVLKWLRPPSMAGLMLHLDISRETWSGYGKRKGYDQVVERARARMEDYWTTRLDSKGAQGAKFALSSCYGWRERRVVGLDEPTRKAMEDKAMPISERAELLRDIARKFGDDEAP